MPQRTPSTFSKALRVILWFVIVPAIVIAVGAAGMVVLVKMRKTPKRTQPSAAIARVKALRIVPHPVRLSVTGYGTAASARRVELSAEVGGKVVWVSPLLRAGSRVSAEAELVRIDKTDYELARRRAYTDLQLARTSLERLRTEQANQKGLLDIARDELELSRRDLERLEGLHEQGTVSQQQVDVARQATLRYRTTIRNIENRLDLLPVQIREQQALIDRATVRLEEAQVNLDRTVIRAPFAATVLSETIGLGQNVQPRMAFATLIDPDAIEVPVELSLSDLGALPRGEGPRGVNIDGVDTRVSWTPGNRPPTVWAGEVVRIEPVDYRTRTIPLVVRVPEPSEPIEAGAGRRVLEENMFCEVELLGRRLPEAVTVPRSALKEDDILWVARPDRLIVRAFGARVLDVPMAPDERLPDGLMADGASVLAVTPRHRLTMRPVEVERLMDRRAVIGAGLRPGELVVTTPVPYPLEDMPLIVTDVTGRER